MQKNYSLTYKSDEIEKRDIMKVKIAAITLKNSFMTIMSKYICI